LEKEGKPLDNVGLSSRMPGHEEKAQDRKRELMQENKQWSRKDSTKKKRDIGKQRYSEEILKI